MHYENHVQEVVKEPLYVFQNHKKEGFSIDWNPIHTGVMLSGDNDGALYLWKPNDKGSWNYEFFNYKTESGINSFNKNENGPSCSIEDIEWLPNGAGVGSVFAMCSTDGSIRIKDIRIFQKKEKGKNNGNKRIVYDKSINNNSHKNSSEINILNGHHGKDVNCIAWNAHNEFLLASGGDDNIGNIWDTRMFDEPVAILEQHKDAISSISWHPTDSSVLLLSCFDGTISFWDLSIESAAINKKYDDLNIPDQLLFEHVTENCITEAKFHPQYNGYVVATSSADFSIFKPFNV